MSLAGRVALVTGAQQGIGAAVAVSLGAQGAAVVVNYLDDESAAAAVVAQIVAAGGRAEAVAGDVRDRADVAAMVDAGEQFGGVELLVNNAGTFPRVPLLEMTDEQWSTVLDVNLAGTFRCTQVVARRLRQVRRPGAVVNLSSVAAYRGSPLGAHYGASKAGVIGFTRAASIELAPLGIRVNAVAPGLTDTAQPRDGMTEAEIARASAHVPLGAMATPKEIADVVKFLLSGAAGHITGQVLHVNGGSYFG